MANLTGSPQVFHGNTTTTDATAQVSVGTRGFDNAGGEFIYLLGTASTTAGTWVTYNVSTPYTELLAANGIGAVAIAGTSITAGLYGWYQIFGKNTQAKTDTVAANAPLYIDGTNGRADDADVAGDTIYGAFSLTADTSNVATVFLMYPRVTDVAAD